MPDYLFNFWFGLGVWITLAYYASYFIGKENMKIKMNTNTTHGGVTYTDGQELDVDEALGNELLCSGICGVLEHDSPKRRIPKNKVYLPPEEEKNNKGKGK